MGTHSCPGSELLEPFRERSAITNRQVEPNIDYTIGASYHDCGCYEAELSHLSGFIMLPPAIFTPSVASPPMSRKPSSSTVSSSDSISRLNYEPTNGIHQMMADAESFRQLKKEMRETGVLTNSQTVMKTFLEERAKRIRRETEEQRRLSKQESGQDDGEEETEEEESTSKTSLPSVVKTLKNMLLVSNGADQSESFQSSKSGEFLHQSQNSLAIPKAPTRTDSSGINLSAMGRNEVARSRHGRSSRMERIPADTTSKPSILQSAMGGFFPTSIFAKPADTERPWTRKANIDYR